MHRKLKLLIIAFPDSIHTARWIDQIDREKIEVHLFPSVAFKNLHPIISNIIFYRFGTDQLQKKSVEVRDLNSRLIQWAEKSIPSKLFQRILFKFGIKRLQGLQLRRLLKIESFDIVHTMESQHAGYFFSSECHVTVKKWIHSTWGIDLHFYSRINEHSIQLRNMLKKVDCLVVEGDRDEALARQLGFTGNVIEIPSVGGGFDIQNFPKPSTSASERRKIILKGYEGHERLASNALKALQKVSSIVKDYEVVVYSCNDALRPIINEIQVRGDFTIIAIKEIPQADLLNLVTEARISITNNLSDGVPNTMLEAMAMGTFPIQSNTAITKGWIEHGVTGFVTDPLDIDQIAECIQNALTDDKLVDHAGAINRERIFEKLAIHSIKNRIVSLYE